MKQQVCALLCAALFCGALSVAAAESKNVPFVFENGAMQSSVASAGADGDLCFPLRRIPLYAAGR